MLDTWAFDEGIMDMAEIVFLHMSTNFYPGFPDGWVEGATPLIVEAIGNCQEDDSNAVIEWPLSLQPYPAGGEPDFDREVYLVKSYAVVDKCKVYPLV